MKIQAMREETTDKIIVNIILTEAEVKKLIAGGVVNGDEPQLAIQIVGYGEEEVKAARP